MALMVGFTVVAVRARNILVETIALVVAWTAVWNCGCFKRIFWCCCQENCFMGKSWPGSWIHHPALAQCTSLPFYCLNFAGRISVSTSTSNGLKDENSLIIVIDLGMGELGLLRCPECGLLVYLHPVVKLNPWHPECQVCHIWKGSNSPSLHTDLSWQGWVGGQATLPAVWLQ